MNQKIPQEQSVVSQRLAWLQNRQVRLHLKTFDQPFTQTVEATYLDVIPVGRAYFFVLLVDGRKTLIETDSVLQIIDLSGEL